MAHPRRHRRHGFQHLTLAALAVLAIAGASSITASMLMAQPKATATPGPIPVAAGDAPVTRGEAVRMPLPALPPPTAVPHLADPPPSVPPRMEPDASLPIDHDDARAEPDRPEPPVEQAPPPLPVCETGDRRAPGIDDDDEWQTALLDRTYGLPRRYRPAALVSVRQAGFDSGWRVRAEVIEDLAAMRKAARRAGAPLAVVSGYRSYQNQATVFDMWRGHLGRDAISASARPGHSEHQLGTSLDFRSAENRRDPWHYKDWGKTPEGRWLAANSWRYGFVLSYPRGAEPKTCYGYEPWHFRYVGRELAMAVRGSGLTLREYLWQEHSSEP